MMIRRVGLLFCLVGGVGWTAPADAQTIRTYGDQSETRVEANSGGAAGSAGGAAWYPGMPRPQSQASSTQEGAAAGSAQEESEDVPAGSIRVRFYDGTSRVKAPRKTLDLALDKLYRGVIPGKRDAVAHLKAERERAEAPPAANSLTWLGFQPEETKTRVFLQTAREADYNLSMDEARKTVVLRLAQTEFSDRNFARSVDTRFFGRNVQSVRARGVRSEVVVEISLERVERPLITQSGDYLYVDFSHEPKRADENSSD